MTRREFVKRVLALAGVAGAAKPMLPSLIDELHVHATREVLGVLIDGRGNQHEILSFSGDILNLEREWITPNEARMKIARFFEVEDE